MHTIITPTNPANGLRSSDFEGQHAYRHPNYDCREQSGAVKEEKKDVTESMHYIKELGYEILEAVESDNITEVGRLFDAHWQHKKKISSKMSNPKFDEIYEAAKKNGALGGKISGAGGGGFFTFYVEEKHGAFREAMKKFGLREMRYKFDFEGTKVIADF